MHDSLHSLESAPSHGSPSTFSLIDSYFSQGEWHSNLNRMVEHRVKKRKKGTSEFTIDLSVFAVHLHVIDIQSWSMVRTQVLYFMVAQNRTDFDLGGNSSILSAMGLL